MRQVIDKHSFTNSTPLPVLRLFNQVGTTSTKPGWCTENKSHRRFHIFLSWLWAGPKAENRSLVPKLLNHLQVIQTWLTKIIRIFHLGVCSTLAQELMAQHIWLPQAKRWMGMYFWDNVLLCFGLFVSQQAVRWQHRANGGKWPNRSRQNDLQCRCWLKLVKLPNPTQT